MQSFPTTVINASGIYGNLRWGLLDRLAKSEKLNVLYDKVSNAIHEIDLAGFIVYLIKAQLQLKSESVLADRYIATDNKAYSFAQIAKFLSTKSVKHAEALLVVENRNEWQRFTKSKVCSNQRMRELGFKLSYPTRSKCYAEIIIAWSKFQLLTEFQRRVLLEVAKIPWGKTRSYKDLGDRVNCRCYRAIGQVLRINPCAPLIPCHRVIQADGRIGGFQGDRAGDSIAKKRRLLASEGVYLQ